jgi:thiamine-monophosphate kinase
MNEFDLIAKYFRPLAERAPGAFQLLDDAAAVVVPAGEELILTTDAIIAGTHFLAGDPIDSVAKKLLRVNVSDLAAKGARPLGYLLACMWPQGTPEQTIAGFAAALGEDQARYGLSLFGGDTTSTAGPLAFTLTALGLAPQGRMIKRAGARAGDLVFVTGTIGDAYLGLRAAAGELEHASSAHNTFLVSRYRLPEPPLAFMLAARDLIHAAIDVSDGLVADAGHIAQASGVAIAIDAARLPLSDAASSWIAAGGELALLATGGDDYEVCFTAPAATAPALEDVAQASATRLSIIGRVSAGHGVALHGADGREIPLPRTGYTHF